MGDSQRVARQISMSGQVGSQHGKTLINPDIVKGTAIYSSIQEMKVMLVLMGKSTLKCIEFVDDWIDIYHVGLVRIIDRYPR
jgi:hypothetical protein